MGINQGQRLDKRSLSIAGRDFYLRFRIRRPRPREYKESQFVSLTQNLLSSSRGLGTGEAFKGEK